MLTVPYKKAIYRSIYNPKYVVLLDEKMINVRSIENLTEQEFKHGIFGGITGGSWHEKYKDSAWVFIGGLSFELTEGDVICVMSQWGEIEDIHLVREKDTNKSKGFAFVKYEDSRSGILAVDNFNGISLLGRTLRCDHVENYKLPKEILDKESEILDNDPAAEVNIGPGHAYKHKELGSEYDINMGVDLWGASDAIVSSSSLPIKRHEGTNSIGESKEKQRKKHKHKHRHTRKEKHQKIEKDISDDDAYRKGPHKVLISDLNSSTNMQLIKVDSRQRDFEGMHENRQETYLKPSVVASWRGNRDPELQKLKMLKTENLVNNSEDIIFSSSNNKIYEEKKRDEFSSFGGYKRAR